MKLLENKVALVTGAGSGIGEAIAKIYAKNGAKVIVNDINKENGQSVVEQIKSENGEAYFIPADASKETEVHKMIAKAIEKYGQLDIACNNAGIGGVGLTKNIGAEYAQKNIRCNAVGPAYIDTPLLGGLENEMLEAIKSKHPMNRLGKPEEVAELVLFLSSDKSSFMTGGYYLIDGGYTAI